MSKELEPLRGSEVTNPVRLVQLALWILDTVEALVEEHKHVVILEEEASAPVPVVVVVVFRQCLVMFVVGFPGHLETSRSVSDGQVQRHLLRSATRLRPLSGLRSRARSAQARPN